MKRSKIEQAAVASWRAWAAGGRGGGGYAGFRACAICGEHRYCRGRTAHRQICLECFDTGKRGRR